MNNIKGKAALVFGGSRGIGAAIVERLARDGYVVAFTYVSRADSAEALVAKISAEGGEAVAIHAASADAAAIREAVEHAAQRLGAIDVLVVNAGRFSHNTIDAVPLHELDMMLAANVRGVFLAIQAAVPHLKDKGRVVTIGSNVAIRTGSAGSSVYQMTKGAVAAMVKGIALDLAPRGITVNNVQPGPTATEILGGVSVMEQAASRTALKRIGKPEEIAGLVAYLTGEGAGYMTGESLTIDGGFVL